MNQILAELRRRHVFRVAAAYLVVCWIVMQVVAVIGGAAGLPEWADSLVLVILLAFAPVVLFIAWAFELTPEGIKPTQKSGDAGISGAGPADFALGGLLILVLAVAGYQAFFSTSSPAMRDQSLASNTTQQDASETGNEIVTTATPSNNSIAVLPFSDLSAEGNQQYFGDGLAEELLNVLAGIDALAVTSRTSAFQFKGQDIGVPEIAEQLRVRHVLEGSIRTSGETIRVTAQLIDAETDRHLFSDTYDRPLTAENIFAIQDEIASAIVAALSETLQLDIDDEIAVSALTEDLTAYDAYLEARSLFIVRNQLSRVVALLNRAIEADPDFIQAWEMLAAVLSLYAYDFPEANPERGREVALHVLSMNPESATAHSVLGLLAFTSMRQGEPVEPVQTTFDRYDRALASEPNNVQALNWAGLLYFRVGKLERSLSYFQTCLNVEPLYAPCAENEYDTLVGLGRYDDALRRFEDALDNGNMTIQWVNFELLAHFQERLTFKYASNGSLYLPGWRRHDEIYEAHLDPGPHHRELAEAALDYVEANLPDAGEDFISMVLTPLGAYDLEFPISVWQSSFADYRRSEQFKSHIRLTGILTYWQEQGFPPQCRPVGADDFECD